MIDFNRCDACSGFGKSESQRTKACTNFDDMIIRADIGHTSNTTNCVGVRNKVLSKSAAWRQAMLCQ